ncbi:hypothetical protein I3760_06G040400 [Carya illinoinensis]|nr:hypothetical protein I3760_06G040400 [Carya illinoinensis]
MSDAILFTLPSKKASFSCSLLGYLLPNRLPTCSSLNSSLGIPKTISLTKDFSPTSSAYSSTPFPNLTTTSFDFKLASTPNSSLKFSLKLKLASLDRIKVELRLTLTIQLSKAPIFFKLLSVLSLFVSDSSQAAPFLFKLTPILEISLRSLRTLCPFAFPSLLFTLEHLNSFRFTLSMPLPQLTPTKTLRSEKTLINSGLGALPLWADVEDRTCVSLSLLGTIEAAAALSTSGTGRITGLWEAARGREAGLGFSLPVDEDLCKILMAFLLEMEIGVSGLEGLTVAAPRSFRRQADETDIGGGGGDLK